MSFNTKERNKVRIKERMKNEKYRIQSWKNTGALSGGDALWK